ncbi:hypothetical protein [Salibacterium halotolerans]|uniref:Sporulation lipoprotein YhcN/YlaJ (Spore_YhcN_YlaJ) n=1 Tax=Salibacterium halotolerans TaxID=1884432 RepID=A0A1I5PTW1_9BACI|nr:hypothetical protein [Salibacterium halotolerans]SFP37364.1 hypothetical protein SAMN05518683_104224 [Salibacterium halotolerans]
MRYVLLFVLMCLCSACGSSTNEETLSNTDPSPTNQEEMGFLHIQKISADNASAGTKIIKDKEKIQNILSATENVKVQETSKNTNMEKQTDQPSYLFSFSKQRNVNEQAAYSFFLYQDGTIIILTEQDHNYIVPPEDSNEAMERIQEIANLTDED